MCFRLFYTNFHADLYEIYCADSILSSSASLDQIGSQVEFLGNFGPLRPMWSFNALTAGSVTTLTVVADGSSIYDSNAIGYVRHTGGFRRPVDTCSEYNDKGMLHTCSVCLVLHAETSETGAHPVSPPTLLQ